MGFYADLTDSYPSSGCGGGRGQKVYYKTCECGKRFNTIDPGAIECDDCHWEHKQEFIATMRAMDPDFEYPETPSL